MADSKITLPKGYDDEDAFLLEARTRFLEAESYDRENREAALDDLKFLAGDQWDASALKRRKGRPCLTINQLPQFVAQVVGDIRINKPAIKVRPDDDGDKDVAEVRQDLIRTIEHRSKASAVYTMCGQAQTACGIGNFRVKLDYADDGSFDQDIFIRPIPNPFAVVWDPMSIDNTGKDARYCFVVDEMPRKDFEDKYPDEQANELPTMVGNLEAQGWMTKDVVRVTEYWLMKETEVELAKLADGSVVPVAELPKGAKPVKTRKATKKSACMYLITGHKVLEGPYELPINRVPIFRAEGWKINIGERVSRFGLVRFAKDPTRLKNYWRSVSAEVLALAPRQQWLMHESADKGETVDDFREAHQSGDPVLLWGGSQKPERMDPPAFPAAIVQEAALNAQDLKDVTGIHDASLGAQSNETSGKAIMARDRQGDVATYIYPDNLHDTISEAGQVINDLLDITYDTARTVTRTGEDGNSRPQRINDPNHENSVDLVQGKYHVTIDTGPSYSTKRVEAAEGMLAFAQAVPGLAQNFADLLAKAQDWPMAEDIADRIKRSLPPQVTQDPNEPAKPPTPEQQEMAEMQRQAASLDMETKRALAAKATAEAGQALFTLGQMHGGVEDAAGQMATNQLFGGQPPAQTGPGMVPPTQPAMPATQP